MIKLTNLSTGYAKGQPVLQQATTTLHAGRIYGLLGANGSGKTTLLKTLTGCITPLGGEVNVMGKNPANRTRNFLAEIVYMPDEIILPTMSADSFVKAYSPFWPQFSCEKFRNYLNLFDVEANAKLSSLSLGNRKKFYLAFALACNTRLLILDEPTNGLDIVGKKVFRQILASEINDERTIIVSSHLVGDLERLISDVIILRNNHIALNASIDTIAELLTFGNATNIAESIYKDGLRGIGRSEGEYSDVDLELLYLALHDNSANQQIIDLVSGKEELC